MIEGVGTEPRILTDGQKTVEIRPITNPHVADMVAVYLPAEKVLFQSDLYNPGATIDPTNPNVATLYDWVVESGIQVDRLIGGHGAIGPFRDLARAMATVPRPSS
jgi:hypothetical protein